jgi:hypothetical protein
MTAEDDQCLYLDELARRWRLDMDRIVELAINDGLLLWIRFTDVSVRQAEHTQKKSGSREKKTKPPVAMRHERVEVRPTPDVLRQIHGRCDRMLITSELSCLDAKGQPVVLTNSVGDEWGETSMIGLRPTALFARQDDIAKFERKNKIIHRIAHVKYNKQDHSANQTPLTVPLQDHPHFAPELHVAATCWHALFAGANAPVTEVNTAAINAWLAHHHPHLSQAARKRIALVVAPGKNSLCQAPPQP